MKPLLMSFAAGLVLVAGGAFGLDRGPRSNEADPWKLRIDLVDGSRIVGDPAQKSLELDVQFDRLQIPLERVRHAQWLKGRRSVRVELKNRDVVTGKLMAKKISMSTIFGEVVLDTSKMKSLDVIPADRMAWLPTERGLVLYYSFDRHDGARVINHAADHLHGKATNVRWIDEGRRGGAVEFDGNASIEIPHHEDLCPATLTMAAWIHPNANRGSYELVMAKTNGGSWSEGYGLVRRSGEPDHLTFFVNHYSSHGATVKTPIGKWSHIAGVFDGTTVRVYLNGELAGTTSVGSSSYGDVPREEGEPYKPQSNLRHSKTPLYLGRNDSGYSWSGKMDELVIYSRALEPAEIKDLYRAGAW